MHKIWLLIIILRKRRGINKRQQHMSLPFGKLLFTFWKAIVWRHVPLLRVLSNGLQGTEGGKASKPEEIPIIAGT